MTTISSASQSKSIRTIKDKTNLHVGVITPQDQKDSEIFCKSLEAMCELGLNVSLLAEGSKDIQRCCFELSERYPEQFEMLESNSQNYQILLGSIDTIVFSENPAKKIVAEVISRNIVSILPEGNGLQNFNLKKESGEAFTYKEKNIWSFVSAVVRANENFKFPYDWKTIKHNLSMIVF